MTVDDLPTWFQDRRSPSFYTTILGYLSARQNEATGSYYYGAPRHSLCSPSTRPSIRSPAQGYVLADGCPLVDGDQVFGSGDKSIVDEFFDPAGEMFPIPTFPRQYQRPSATVTPLHATRAATTMTTELE